MFLMASEKNPIHFLAHTYMFKMYKNKKFLDIKWSAHNIWSVYLSLSGCSTLHCNGLLCHTISHWPMNTYSQVLLQFTLHKEILRVTLGHLLYSNKSMFWGNLWTHVIMKYGCYWSPDSFTSCILISTLYSAVWDLTQLLHYRTDTTGQNYGRLWWLLENNYSVCDIYPVNSLWGSHQWTICVSTNHMPVI